MRNKNAERNRQREISHKRGDKHHAQDHPNLSQASLRFDNALTFKVDLHGRLPSDVRKYVLNGISDALLGKHDLVTVVHGYNKGNSIKNEVQGYLKELKGQKLIRDYRVNPNNPGETIVSL